MFGLKPAIWFETWVLVVSGRLTFGFKLVFDSKKGFNLWFLTKDKVAHFSIIRDHGALTVLFLHFISILTVLL